MYLRTGTVDSRDLARFRPAFVLNMAGLAEFRDWTLVSCFLTAGFRYINQLRSGARLHGLIMATTTLEGKVLMGK